MIIYTHIKYNLLKPNILNCIKYLSYLLQKSNNYLFVFY